jgi:hypothetical protein
LTADQTVRPGTAEVAVFVANDVPRQPTRWRRIDFESETGVVAPEIESVARARRGSEARSATQGTDDSVFGVVELQSIRGVGELRCAGKSVISPGGKVPIDADITIRTMRGDARDLDGVKDPGKCNPTQGFLAIKTVRLTDVPNQVCQCRHEQGREYRVPDGYVLLSGFVETHDE